MSTNWSKVKKQIKTLREYLKQIPQQEKIPHACLITKEEIDHGINTLDRHLHIADEQCTG